MCVPAYSFFPLVYKIAYQAHCFDKNRSFNNNQLVFIDCK